MEASWGMGLLAVLRGAAGTWQEPDGRRHLRYQILFPLPAAGPRQGPDGRRYLRYQILSFLSLLIFLCSCRMPYSRASAVGGQPVDGTVPKPPC